jgi:hypothetical protein
MMKSLGMVLIGAAAIAFLVPNLHVTLPEGVSMPTLPTDILGGLLLVGGFIASNAAGYPKVGWCFAPVGHLVGLSVFGCAHGVRGWTGTATVRIAIGGVLRLCGLSASMVVAERTVRNSAPEMRKATSASSRI